MQFPRFDHIFVGLLAFLLTFFMYATVHAADLAPQDFAAQILQAIQAFGGLPWMGKVASIVLLVIASMKVSIINQWVWSKIPGLQVWVAPILGLVAGVLSLGSGMSLASALAYISAGAGAIILHELLDSVKLIPGIGAVYVGLIDVIEGFLGGPASQPVVIASIPPKK